MILVASRILKMWFVHDVNKTLINSAHSMVLSGICIVVESCSFMLFSNRTLNIGDAAEITLRCAFTEPPYAVSLVSA